MSETLCSPPGCALPFMHDGPHKHRWELERDEARAEIGQLRAALQAALAELTCSAGEDTDGAHYCGRCDNLVDRNSPARNQARAAIEEGQANG